MGTIRYLCRSLEAQFNSGKFACPNCGAAHSDVIERKYIITQLRRCRSCELLFRTPTDDAKNNKCFYDKRYSQGFTTETPTDDVLNKLKQSNFVGTEKNYSYYIDVLNQIGIKPGDRIFDFGCSWGYGSFQLERGGFEVVAYEVAPKRRQYAEAKLGIKLVLDMEPTVMDASHQGRYDCFFSSHVIEHVPSPAKVFEYAFKLLRNEGLFVSFTPNGSSAARARNPNWKQLWGEVHPNFVDERFLERSFANSPRIIGSSPVLGARLPEAVSTRRLDDLSGSELFFAARKAPGGW